jgi:hypothetical protein
MDEIEFLKLNFADTVATVRAYDTKSQIVLASTALSLTPLVSAIRDLDASPWVNVRLALLLTLFIVVFLMFLLVLAPASGHGRKTGNARGGLFFIRNPAGFDPERYLQDLSTADLKLEYANEILALHNVRGIKNARFKRALFSLMAYLGIVFVYGLAMLARIL